MLRGYLRTARYAHGWTSGCAVTARETWIDRDGSTVPATLLTPNDHTGRLPGWIAVGGVSRMGRHHPQLVRFSKALAASGSVVIVPEVPEWRELTVTPAVIGPTLRGALKALRARPEVRPERFGAIGFSFGAPGLAIAASNDELARDIAGIVLFGGYYSLGRTLECMMTGRHDWEGVDYDLDPDPYGRWVVASNHLLGVPGCEDAADVADALRTLATAASGERVSAWDPHHDKMIRGLRAALPAARRSLFDHFATPSDGERPPREESSALAEALTEACKRRDPLLEPADSLKDTAVPVQVIHGHSDRLVPFTEAYRLSHSVQDGLRKSATITRLFAHSAESRPSGFVENARERMRLFAALREMIITA